MDRTDLWFAFEALPGYGHDLLLTRGERVGVGFGGTHLVDVNVMYLL